MQETSSDLAGHIELGYPPHASRMLQRVGGKGSLGPVVHDRGVTWRATRHETGHATVAITPTDTGAEVLAWGPGASEGFDAVPDLLGFSDDPSGLRCTDGPVAKLLAANPTYRMTRTNSIWEHVMTTVLGQKVPVASAARSWQAILGRWGERPPGPGPENLMLGPHPEAIAGLAYHQLHPMNVERKRAEVIIVAAARSHRLEEALDMSPPQARGRLEAIRGIGPWTSAIVTQLGLGDPDAVITGDYNLPSLIAWNLAGERTADDDRMLELLEPYRGQRARVQNLAKFGGTKPPRRGPKLSITDLRGR